MIGKNMSLKAQLGIGFGSILLFMLILTIIGYSKVNFANNTLIQISDVNSVKQRYAINFRGSVHDRAIAVRDVVLLHDEDTQEMQKTIEEIKKLEAFYSESAMKMNEMATMPNMLDDKDKEILQKIIKTKEKTAPIIHKIIELRLSNQTEQAHDLLLELARPYFTEWLAVINEFIDYQEAKNKNLSELASSSIKDYLTLNMILTAIAFILAVLIAGYIARLIVSSLGGEPREAIKAVLSIANGNLNTNIKVQFQNSMLSSMVHMQNKLRDIVSEVSRCSDELGIKANEVSKCSKEAQSSSYRQLDKSEEATKNINSCVITIAQVAQIAQQTEDNSEQTTKLSQQGKVAMLTTIKEIEAITQTVSNSADHIRALEKYSQEISGSAELIKEITDQTNLLALNAAIEAARAGEAGRGFAVVADEIRKLAESTGEATSEITKMIEIIQKETQTAVDAIREAIPQVEKGMRLANEANEILEQINTQAEDSLEKAREVAQSTQEQQDSMQHISSEMTDISTDSKNTSKLMEDSTNAANNLQDISNQLKKHMEYFKI
ncbi:MULTISPECIES: methyl-accepting chemotaxis protein [Helicobacter]|uniref:Methyl-accepting chemotaxis protein n=1 Tax=Helicobacter ibis TaxID=2962633 RepID=A0ABT4VCW1_9HELI|nr:MULTISPECIES: methyl-accepting chemotaxis protein [Helicobacter]MDA3966689.1 methyl-accepting chemotaxis protein [Helicobacter sp. WB40]MDA3968543.1 methyl-accepting chemotaxis protein [Helicobacter ibis]